MDLFAEMQRRYRAGDLPWDHELPPPEVIDLAARLPAGQALDLGCGAGRACIFLARHGWQCDGVDFVPEAVALAEERARAAGVAGHARFHLGSAARLDFLQPFYDLAIDVGCLHNLRGDDLRGYAGGLARLLRPGAAFLLFARIADTAEAPRGLPEQTIYELLKPAFVCEQIERGTSPFGDELAPSAWFWMRRVTQL